LSILSQHAEGEGMSIKTSITLTILFDDPFWIGLFSISEGDFSKYCKITFGSEPSDIQVYDYCLKNFYHLQFSEFYETPPFRPDVKNPKRLQREINREIKGKSGIKKSYDVIKEQIKLAQKNKVLTELKESEREHKEYIYKLKRLKRRNKHLGH
jgi:hypothetical protein